MVERPYASCERPSYPKSAGLEVCHSKPSCPGFECSHIPTTPALPWFLVSLLSIGDNLNYFVLKAVPYTGR